jgi:hypothetical protein
MSNLSIRTNIFATFRPEFRLIWVVLGALVIGILAFCAYHFFATRELREMVAAPNGEMEWLRQEYHLSDAQFKKIETLHSAYVPICNEMCSRIAAANAKLDRLVSDSKEITPELQNAIQEDGVVQGECRKQMLAHIYQVSAQMSPAEGERYLRMMKARIIQPGLASDTAVRAGTE